MKYKRLAVFIEIKNGKFYQVALSEKQMFTVLSLVNQMHGGSTKVLREEFTGMSFEKK